MNESFLINAINDFIGNSIRYALILIKYIFVLLENEGGKKNMSRYRVNLLTTTFYKYVLYCITLFCSNVFELCYTFRKSNIVWCIEIVKRESCV